MTCPIEGGGGRTVVPAANTSCLYANHPSYNSLPHALRGHAEENSCHEHTMAIENSKFTQNTFITNVK
jgi:hypothetical protein